MEDQQGAAKFEAQISRKRMFVLMMFALGFAIVGLLFVSSAEELAQSIHSVFFRDPVVLRVFGWVAMAFGLAGAVVALTLIRRIWQLRSMFHARNRRRAILVSPGRTRRIFLRSTHVAAGAVAI